MKFPLLVLCLLLLPALLNAQEAAKAREPAATATAAAPAGPVKSLSIDVAILRFKPAKAERILQGFKDISGSLAFVVDRLKSEGEVSVLYSGNRELRIEEKSKAKFDALETRPVVLVGKPGAPVPPVTAYGLTLELTAKNADADRFGLAWEGTVTWSPEIVDSWKGEGFLHFMGSAAGIAKQAGAMAGDAKGIGNAADIGLSFAQLFSPKGGSADSQIYELPVNKTVSLTSSRVCRSGDCIVCSTTAEMGSKEAQTILLVMWPTLAP